MTHTREDRAIRGALIATAIGAALLLILALAGCGGAGHHRGGLPGGVGLPMPCDPDRDKNENGNECGQVVNGCDGEPERQEAPCATPSPVPSASPAPTPTTHVCPGLPFPLPVAVPCPPGLRPTP